MTPKLPICRLKRDRAAIKPSRLGFGVVVAVGVVDVFTGGDGEVVGLRKVNLDSINLDSINLDSVNLDPVKQ